MRRCDRGVHGAPWLLAALLVTALGPGCTQSSRGAHGGSANASAPDTGTPTAAKDGYQYRWSKACAGCHPNHYREWQGSLHAQAHSDAIYDFYFMRASRDSKKKLEPFCGRCHTPLGVRSGEIPFRHPLRTAGDTHVSKIAAEGVQCDFCHTISAQHTLKNGGYTLRPGNVKRGPLSDSRSTNHKTLWDPKFRSAEFCGACHEVVHPTNGILLETTYSEWKKGPYAKAGIVCQDCHMTNGLSPPTATSADHLGRPRRHPGKAAVMRKRRPHISRHWFVGPNLVFTNTGPDASPADRAERAARESLLRRAGRVEIRGVRRHLGSGDRVLALRVTNTGAGHYLPTGVSEVRELWLEITFRDAKGKVVLASGHPGQDGNLPKDTILFRTTVVDATGKDTTLFWNAVKKVRDHRIPPLGHLDEQLRLPAGLKGQYLVDVALRYRSVSPKGLAEAGVPKGSIPVPIFTIHQVKKAVTF